MSISTLEATFHQGCAPPALPSALDTSVLGAGDTAHPGSESSLPQGEPTHFGRFRVERRVAEGAEGVLYRAVDEKLGRTVAIKALHGRQTISPAARRRFLDEAKLAASVESDHVVRILEVGDDESAAPYLVMELVEGVSLGEFLRQQGPLPARQAVELVRQAALGLAAVHGRGLIHRDVKSANLLLDAKTGRVKLADFGLAKVLEDELPLTADNFLTGTPAYMSPEQITSPHAIDARSDLYSLGVVLYELLTGQPPFQGSVRIVLTRILHEPPAPPSTHNDLVSTSLDAICLRSLAKSPEARFASASEFAESLSNWLGGKRAPCIHKTVKPQFPLALAIVGLAAIAGIPLLLFLGFALLAAYGAIMPRNGVKTETAAPPLTAASTNDFPGMGAATPEVPPNEPPHVAAEPYAGLEALQHAADKAYEKEDYALASKKYEELRCSAAETRIGDQKNDSRLIELEYEGEYGLFWAAWRLKKTAEAAQHAAAAESLAAKLLAAQASPERFDRLIMVQSDQYSLQYELENWATAQAHAIQACQTARNYLAAFPADEEPADQLAQRLVELGDAEYERSRYAAAEKSYAEAASLLAPKSPELSDALTMTLIEAELGQADCMQEQGRESDSQSLLKTLQKRLAALSKRDDFRGEHADWLKKQQDWFESLKS